MIEGNEKVVRVFSLLLMLAIGLIVLLLVGGAVREYNREAEIAILVGQNASITCADKVHEELRECCRKNCVHSGKYYSLDGSENPPICLNVCAFGEEKP